MKLYIWCNGDASVGIPGSQCSLDWPELSDGHKEEKEFVDYLKKTLQETFSNIFDDRYTYVMTEAEYEKYTASDD